MLSFPLYQPHQHYLMWPRSLYYQMGKTAFNHKETGKMTWLYLGFYVVSRHFSPLASLGVKYTL